MSGFPNLHCSLIWTSLNLCACAGLLAEGPAQEEILQQLPAGMEEQLLDPLTVPKLDLYSQGEHLNFKLGWSLFTVARASLAIEPDQYGDVPAMKIVLRARTNGFADAFYKVRNESVSWVAEDVSGSFEYSALQNEGGRERDTRALFDTTALKARYINNLSGDTKGPVDILPGTFDPLGIVYFVRCIDFDVGDELVVPTSNGKEFFYTIVRVTKLVNKKFPIGRMEAYVLEPDIKDIGGVFKRSPDGKIRFYISADERKLPLRMESEVAVGKFWAELVEIADPEVAESVAITEVE